MKRSIFLLAIAISLSHAAYAEQGTEVPQLKALKEGWTLERQRALRPVDTKYEVALRRLKDQLTKSGDLHGALAVDNEIKEVGLLHMGWTKLSVIRPKDAKVTHYEFLSGNLTEQAKLDDGLPLEIQGSPVEDGLLAHAPSRLAYNLKGKDYKVFRGGVGLADRQNGKVKFRILGDGKEIWSSDTISPEKGNYQTASYSVSVDGVSELELIVEELENTWWDVGIWVAPELGK
jgi:hypothetical protein